MSNTKTSKYFEIASLFKHIIIIYCITLKQLHNIIYFLYFEIASLALKYKARELFCGNLSQVELNLGRAGYVLHI